MTTRNCGLSLVRRNCPRKKFMCRRCAAKLQNSETVWELTVPVYESWSSFTYNPDVALGESPFTANDDGGTPVSFQTIYKTIPQDADGTLQNCNFEGSNSLSFQVPADSVSVDDWPGWAVVFDINRTHLAPPFNTPISFFVPGNFDPPSPSWKSFTIDHDAAINYVNPVMENDSVKVPGQWQINLGIFQDAQFVNLGIAVEVYSFTNLEDLYEFVDNLDGVYAYTIDEDVMWVEIYNPYNDAANSSGTYSGVYQAPDDFSCPIEPGKSYRFHNIIPYNLMPLKVSAVDPVIPEGYGLPKAGVVYPLKPNAEYEGDSFDSVDYIAPPYIDVKHVKRTHEDV